MYTKKYGAIRHAEEKHQWKNPNPLRERAKDGEGQHPCPCSAEYNCGQIFARKFGVSFHAKRKHNYIDPEAPVHAPCRPDGVKREEGEHPCPCREQDS